MNPYYRWLLLFCLKRPVSSISQRLFKLVLVYVITNKISIQEFTTDACQWYLVLYYLYVCAIVLCILIVRSWVLCVRPLLYANEYGHYWMQNVSMREIIIKSCMKCFVNRDSVQWSYMIIFWSHIKVLQKSSLTNIPIITMQRGFLVVF